MRLLLTAALLTGFTMPLHSATFVYVSLAPEQKIQVFQLADDSGRLTSVEQLSVAGTPGSLAVLPNKKLLVASLRSTSRLASFRVDPPTGRLKLLSTAQLPEGENAAFVAVDPTGRWLLSASYAAGKVVVHRINDAGEIESPAVQTVATAKTAHCVAIAPESRFVLVPHVEPNAVYQFRFDAARGQLTEAGKAPGGADQAGPRHLALHPTLPLAFTSNETGSSITAYRYDSETGLQARQTLSTLPADFAGSNSTAEVKVHPSGRFVWVSNRGHDSLAGFRIAETGELTALDRTPTEKTPRSFEIDPSGRFVFGAGEGSGKLAVFRVDVETGKLTRIETLDIGNSLTWVTAAKLGGE